LVKLNVNDNFTV